MSRHFFYFFDPGMKARLFSVTVSGKLLFDLKCDLSSSSGWIDCTEKCAVLADLRLNRSLW